MPQTATVLRRVPSRQIFLAPLGKLANHSCYQTFPAEEAKMGGMLVRNMPQVVREWIEKERQQNQMSQQEFVLSVLQRASAMETTPLLPFNDLPKEPAVPDSLPFKFIDLFAGIGGFRSALSKLGGTCVFSSEWDRYSQKTYKAWYGDAPEGDITRSPRQTSPTTISSLRDIPASRSP
jgi:hypothetical protein